MSPSPLWYAGRGLGIALLLTLTATVALGILTGQSWSPEGWPRFVVAGLHRNLALLSVALLPLHGLAMVLDPYAHLGIKDVTLPFGSTYRPLWLGLGVLGGELMIALVVTSLVRQRLGYRLWRTVHWLAYVSWPLALLHGLGTGSDTRQGWALLANAVCVGTVLGALLWRLARSGGRPGWRVAGGVLCLAGTVALGSWTLAGPLRPGWAAAAGTPPTLIASRRVATGPRPQATTRSPTPTPAGLEAGLDDPVEGTVGQGSTGLQVELVDLRDRTLRIVFQVPGPEAASGPLQVTRDGTAVCATRAFFEEDVVATCGSVRLDLALAQGEGGTVFGRLRTTDS